MARNFLTSLRLVNISSDPPTGNEGELYYNTTTDKVRLYSNGAWIDLVAASAGSLFNVDAIAYPDYIAFDTTPESTSASVGTISWNAGEGGLDSQISTNTAITLGQEVISLVYNAEATTLNKGEVVYLFGAQGQRPSVKRASNLSDATSAKTFGMVAESIASGAEGFVMCQGIVKNIDTNSYNEGDVLWLGSSAGTVTTTKPYAPLHMVFVGVVVKKNASSGRVFVKPQNGYEMDELHDVYAQSPSDNDILSYVSASTMWVKQNLATAITEVDGTGSNIDADLLDGQHGSYYAPIASPTFTGTVNLPTVSISGITTTSNYINRTTGNGNSSWLQQDGTGRVHWYWNTLGGTSPTFTNAAEDASALTLHVNNNGNGGTFFHRSANGASASAGGPITWTTTLYVDLATITYKGNRIPTVTDKLNAFAATTSAELAGVISDETGSGSLVFATSPTLTTPNIGVATGTSFNSITALSSTNPVMNGSVAIGTSTTVARSDHVHPTDTTRLASNISQTGGKSYVTHDFNTYPSLYDVTFVNPIGSSNLPTGMTNVMSYRFIMGAGDVASRGFDLVGAAESNGNLYIRERSIGTWNKLWHNNNDGAGSGLDADLLDGQSGSYYQDATNINAGTLAIARGGTNASATPTQGGIAYGTGSAYAFTSAGTAGQVLTSNGASAPTWQAASSSGTTIEPFFLSGM